MENIQNNSAFCPRVEIYHNFCPISVQTVHSQQSTGARFNPGPCPADFIDQLIVHLSTNIIGPTAGRCAPQCRGDRRAGVGYHSNYSHTTMVPVTREMECEGAAGHRPASLTSTLGRLSENEQHSYNKNEYPVPGVDLYCILL